MIQLSMMAKVFLFLGVSSGWSAEEMKRPLSVQEVRDRIVESRADWEAGESWVTRLPSDEMIRMLGAPVQPLRAMKHDPNAAGQLPSKLDWRDVQGVNWLGPVLNQGSCGSCVAFASIATFEAAVTIGSGIPWLRPTFSPEALFACGGGNCYSGWTSGRAISALKSEGVPDEACLPTTSNVTGSLPACAARCSDYQVRSTRLTRATITTAGQGSIESIKTELQKGPLLTEFTVFADFPAYKSGVYKHVSGTILGGHAVSIVGYDDANRAWIVRNSWGADWGENGFFRISWDDPSGLGRNAWAFEVLPKGGSLTVTAPRGREYVTGVFPFSVSGKGLTRSAVRFYLKGQNGLETPISCGLGEKQECSTAFDTSRLADGRYEIRAEASGVRSVVREFFVLNQEPKIQLQVLAPSSQTVSGKVRFKLKSESSPVPIERIEFKVFNELNQVVNQESYYTVLPQMEIGWGTHWGDVPNGIYRATFRAQIPYSGKIIESSVGPIQLSVKNR